jgi:hypothetical protein
MAMRSFEHYAGISSAPHGLIFHAESRLFKMLVTAGTADQSLPPASDIEERPARPLRGYRYRSAKDDFERPAPESQGDPFLCIVLTSSPIIRVLDVLKLCRTDNSWRRCNPRVARRVWLVTVQARR